MEKENQLWCGIRTQPNWNNNSDNEVGFSDEILVGGGTPAAEDDDGGRSLGNSSINVHNHEVRVVDDERDMLNELEPEANNDLIIGGSAVNETNVLVEPVKPSKSTSTVQFDDDRQTEEVLRNLGLSCNGPKPNLVIINTLNEYNAHTVLYEENGPIDSDPSAPPGFENDYSCNKWMGSTIAGQVPDEKKQNEDRGNPKNRGLLMKLVKASKMTRGKQTTHGRLGRSLDCLHLRKLMQFKLLWKKKRSEKM